MTIDSTKTNNKYVSAYQYKRVSRKKRDKVYWMLYIKGYHNTDDHGRIYEHIYFYEQYHKCCLLPCTDIHHIEPVTETYCNNMPWNLMAIIHSEHTKMNMIDNDYGKYNKKDMDDWRCSKCGS